MTSRRKGTDYRAEMRKFMVHVGSILCFPSPGHRMPMEGPGSE